MIFNHHTCTYRLFCMIGVTTAFSAFTGHWLLLVLVTVCLLIFVFINDKAIIYGQAFIILRSIWCFNWINDILFVVYYKLISTVTGRVDINNCQLYDNNEQNLPNSRTDFDDLDIANCVKQINFELNSVVLLIVRDFIQCWYNKFSYDSQFLKEAQHFLLCSFIDINSRCMKIDPCRATAILISAYQEHLSCIYANQSHSKILGMFCNSQKATEQYEEWLQSNFQFHRALSCPETELCFLRSLSEMVLLWCCSSHVVEAQCVHDFFIEVLSAGVLQPIVSMITTPSFIYETIIKLVSMDKLSSNHDAEGQMALHTERTRSKDSLPGSQKMFCCGVDECLYHEDSAIQKPDFTQSCDSIGQYVSATNAHYDTPQCFLPAAENVFCSLDANQQKQSFVNACCHGEELTCRGANTMETHVIGHSNIICDDSVAKNEQCLISLCSSADQSNTTETEVVFSSDYTENLIDLQLSYNNRQCIGQYIDSQAPFQQSHVCEKHELICRGIDDNVCLNNFILNPIQPAVDSSSRCLPTGVHLSASKPKLNSFKQLFNVRKRSLGENNSDFGNMNTSAANTATNNDQGTNARFSIGRKLERFNLSPLLSRSDIQPSPYNADLYEKVTAVLQKLSKKRLSYSYNKTQKKLLHAKRALNSSRAVQFFKAENILGMGNVSMSSPSSSLESPSSTTSSSSNERIPFESMFEKGGKSISDPQNFHSQPHSERSCHDSSSVNSTISDFTNCLIDIGRGSILEPGNCQIGKCPLLGLSSGAEDSTVLEGVTKLPFDVLSAPDCFFLFQGVTIAGTSTFQEALSSSVFTIYHIEFDAVNFSEKAMPVFKTGTVKRRYREFVSLMVRLEDNPDYRRHLKDVRGPKRWLTLPFKNMDTESVAKRQKVLDRFLKSLIEVQAICNGSELREFLAYDGDTHIAFVKKPTEINLPRIDKMLVRTVSSMFDRLKGLPNVPHEVLLGLLGRSSTADLTASAMTDVDSIDVATSFPAGKSSNRLDDVSRDFLCHAGARSDEDNSYLLDDLLALPGVGNHLPHLERSAERNSPRDESGVDVCDKSYPPLCHAVIRLALQVFGWDNSAWLHRGHVTALLTALLEGEEGHFMKYLNGLMRPGNWLRYIRSLREMVWPGGRPYQAQTRQPDEAEDRTTRSVAHRCLRAGFRGFLPHILGSQAVDEAVDLILDSLQCQRLNKHFLYVLLDNLMEDVFPELLRQDDQI